MSLINIKNIPRKESEKITAQSIQQAIAARYSDHKYIIYNTYLFDWESDYLSVNESDYVYECEIKLTRNDFGKDFNKKSKHLLLESKSDPKKLPNKFFYAVPRGMIASYKIPEYAGLIEAYVDHTGVEIEIIRPAPFLHRENVFDDMKPQLLDKFYHKYIRSEFENYKLNKEIEDLKNKLDVLHSSNGTQAG